MPTASISNAVSERPAQTSVLPEELEFYKSYEWCLNPFLTLEQAIGHLGEEVDKLSVVPNGWQTCEVASNIFLLSCGLLNCVDEYLRGRTLGLPSRLAGTRVGRGAVRFVETISDRPRPRRQLTRWREQWLSSLNDFLSLIAGRGAIEPACLAEAGRRLGKLLETRLPSDLLAQRLGVPNPFSRLDVTEKDILALGDSFATRFPDRKQPILLVGLRTSGTYLAPFLKAFLGNEGYEKVELVTIETKFDFSRNKKGPSRREKKELERYAAQGYWALILDDPPETGSTMLAASDIAHRAGFALGSVKFLAPTHPTKLESFKTFPEHSVVTVLPAQWHKSELLNSQSVQRLLTEYFRNQNFVRVSVVESRRADELSANARLHSLRSDERGIRLKRVFEVQLETRKGEKQTKYVLAKSVGWGWYGYHAFLIGYRLSEYVPPMLGLRDGILYMEWVAQSARASDSDRETLLDASASYVAARTNRLSLTGSTASMNLKGQSGQVLDNTLSRAYGIFLTDRLMRSWVGRMTRGQPCSSPTRIDGNMNRDEWILGPEGWLKTDYEHHSIGKVAINAIDPAYDLACTILDLTLSPEEERRLIRQYIAESGDADVQQRLFINKLLAGLWSMWWTEVQFFDSWRSGTSQRELHRRFINAWNFLVVHTARYCSSLCHPRADLNWRAPLIVLDIDGVLDRFLLGFPCTSAAGIKALSLLNAHEYSIALNSARSAGEVREYCRAYSFAGGAAEYGSYIWDAVRQRGRALIEPEAARQLEELRQHLENIPGVFLDDRHQYSIKAFTYRNKTKGGLLTRLTAPPVGEGAIAPISTHTVHRLLTDLRLDRLTFRHTHLDTIIVSKDVDKGTALVALRDWVLGPDAETIAVGDSETDLAMFREATRSFAPSNLDCRNQARLYGCHIVPHPFQRGLLDIVRKIIHPDDSHCERCNRGEVAPAPRSDDLFLSLLQAMDQKWSTNFRKALPAAYKLFLK